MREVRGAGAVSPAVEELAVLGDPPPGVHRPRDILVTAEPLRWVPGQARGADHRHPRTHVLAQVLAQQRLIQRLAHLLRTRMSVHVNQAWKKPALADQLGTRDRIGGPPIPDRIQIDRITTRQRYTANPENRHEGQIARNSTDKTSPGDSHS